MFWRCLFLVLILINLLLLYQFFMSQKGLVTYLEIEARSKDLKQKVQRVNEENRQLSREIRKLKSEDLYLKKVIRTRMHYVEENEILYLNNRDSYSN